MKKDKRHHEDDVKTKRPLPKSRTAANDFKKNPLALIAAIKSGDTEAFANFYLGYSNSLIIFLTKILGNEEDAKETAQDAFAVLWEKRESLNLHTSLKGFICGMARNMAMDNLKAKFNRLESDSDYVSAISQSGEYVAEEIVKRETELLIEFALMNMPPQRRKVYQLSREEGMTYQQIADTLNLSYNTVMNHMKLALRDIRAALSVMLALLFLQ